jgi:hypothetical protein
MTALYGAGETVDVLTVANQLQRTAGLSTPADAPKSTY